MPNYSFLRQIVTKWQPVTCFRVTQRDACMGGSSEKNVTYFGVVYGGEHFCRVSELCDLNSLQECKLKRNLKVAPFLTLVARGGPVAQQTRTKSGQFLS